MFDSDWAMAVNAHGLAKYIDRAQALVQRVDAQEPRERMTQLAAMFISAASKDAVVGETSAEVAEAREAMWRRRYFIYNAFDYYALDGARDDEQGEADVYSISFNAFHTFTRDMKWECDRCPYATFDIIFKQVDTDHAGNTADTFNRQHALARHEFFQAIVRIAVMRFVR